MEKLLFLFPRKTGLTREEFFDHYLTVHAPLGLELTRTMRRYTVNLHDGDDAAPEGVDAFTETWTDSVASFMSVEESFATPEDAQRLMNDHDSFIGDPYFAYTVEEHVAKGSGVRPAPTGGRADATKTIVLATDDATREAVVRAAVAHDDVTDVVENRVAQAVMPGSPEAAAFVLVWSSADVVDALDAPPGATAYAVSEYVQK
jgi:EthD domain